MASNGRHNVEEESISPDQAAFALRSFVLTPCQDACPVSLQCHGYIGLIREGKFEDAYRLIRQRLPFPMTLGRVCNAPCEVKCNRSQMDMALSLRDLKRFVSDYAYENRTKYMPRVKTRREEKIAIVGAGPAGLSAAHDLAREGFQVTVFDELPVAGGMLAVGCPEYRLPKKILETEIENVTGLGVEIKLNYRITGIDELFRQGYRATFIATGAHRGIIPAIPGAELSNVLTATAFLREINLGRPFKLGRKVLVIGGGDVAFDCARTAIRLGANVNIACLETRERMPAHRDEILAAEQEGILIHPLRTITRILGHEGRVQGAECFNVRWMQFDKEGRLHIDIVPASEHILPADTVIFAIGQVPDLGLIRHNGDLEITERGIIRIDSSTLATKLPGVFAGGDAATNAGSVVQAIADGQRAALSITSYLNGEEPSVKIRRRDDEFVVFPTVQPSEEQLSHKKPRVMITPIPLEVKGNTFIEAIPSYSAVQAIEEASRCLRCDLMRPEETIKRLYPLPGTLNEQHERIRRELIHLPVNELRRSLLHNFGIHKKLKRKAENVLSLSCGVFGMALQIVTSMKLLDHLGIEYTYLRDERCCGLPQLEWGAGSLEDFEKAENACREFAESNLTQAREAGAKRLIYFCQWCAYVGKKYLAKERDIELLYYPDILVERLGQLRELKPNLSPRKVGYYEGCHLRNITFAPGVEINWKAYRKLVEVINGVEVVDLSQWKCCVIYHDGIIEEAVSKGLASIVTPCAACWTWLERYGGKRGMPVKMVQDLLAEAVGEKTMEGFFFPV